MANNLAVELHTFSKKPNSTRRPTPGKTYFGDFKETTSMLHPNIAFNFGRSENPTAYNYAYIPEFSKRVYYINDWSWEQGVWIAHMDVDYLGSWRDAIGEMEQYILRSAARFDGGILDFLYPAKTTTSRNTVQVGKIWDNGELGGTGAGRFWIGVVNEDAGRKGALKYYGLTYDSFSQLMAILLKNLDWMDIPKNTISKLIGDVDGKDVNITLDNDLNSNLLKMQFNPLQYIRSCVWVPYTNMSEKVEFLKIGYWVLQVTGDVFTTNVLPVSRNVKIPKHPEAGLRGAYLNSHPFTRYTLFAGPFGTITLDPMLLQGVGSIDLDLKTDYTTGDSILSIYPAADVPVAPILQIHGQLGVPVPLAQIAKNYLGQATTLYNTVGNAISGIRNLDPGQVVNSVVDGIGNMIEQTMPQVSMSGTQGNSAQLTTSWWLRGDFLHPTDEDREHLGRPYCKPGIIKNFDGYILVKDAEIDLPCTLEEKIEIKKYMESGFYWQ